MYCDKCGSKMVSTPGRLHVDGYRTSNYGCPLRRNTKKCNNPTVNDIVIGEFVINYILNMLNAKKTFSTINTPDELNAALLSGSVFSEVSSVEENGLNSFFNLLSRYGSDRYLIFFQSRTHERKRQLLIRNFQNSEKKKKSRSEHSSVYRTFIYILRLPCRKKILSFGKVKSHLI